MKYKKGNQGLKKGRDLLKIARDQTRGNYQCRYWPELLPLEEGCRLRRRNCFKRDELLSDYEAN
jgi:hypothetical protein